MNKRQATKVLRAELAKLRVSPTKAGDVYIAILKYEISTYKPGDERDAALTCLEAWATGFDLSEELDAIEDE